MSSLEDVIAKFPPSIPSRCSPPELRCNVCPKYLFDVSPRPYGSAVQFQLTYTCDRISYSPCYFPAIPRCRFSEKEPKKVTCCCFKWFDCTGKPVLTCQNNHK
ncbi:hypothetical protein ALC56_05187 [Trachymyrmex septentrionalis]|uniref:Uncharacterized protein n=1 Tax=Trachymyrmex septentrionalis TaxID=34720 RepID=A0A195FJ01_9HYME|nr:hypothetical protein ALC56_05187 [Trachymyrmex septentrionalis]